MYFTYSPSLRFLQTIAIERWLAKQMRRKINDFFWQRSRQKFSVLHLFFQLKRFFNVVYLWIFVLFYSQLPWFVVRFQLLSSLKDKPRASLNLESRNSTERLRNLPNILIAQLVKLPILYEEAYFAVIRQPYSEYSDRVRGHSEGHPMISSGTWLGKLGSLKSSAEKAVSGKDEVSAFCGPYESLWTPLALSLTSIVLFRDYGAGTVFSLSDGEIVLS